jgi:CheY-like chemotaxis protein
MPPHFLEKNKQNEALGLSVKILVADDSVTMHRAVTLGLKGSRFQVLTCDNGEDALRIVSKERPSVVLADYEMPGLSGAELISAIRKNPELNFIKTVLLLSNFENLDESFLARIPSDARIRKPFEARTLTALLDKLLSTPKEGFSDPMPVGSNLRESFEPTLVAPDSEIAKSLTEETFKQVEERTREIEKTLIGESPGIKEWQDPEIVIDRTQSQLSDPSDLWGLQSAEMPNFKIDPAVYESVETIQENRSENFEIIKNETLPQDSWGESPQDPEEVNEFAVERIGVESQSEQNNSDFLDHHIPRPPLPTSGIPSLNAEKDPVVGWNQDQDFSEFSQEAATRIEQNVNLKVSGPTFSEVEIRNIIREEIREAFSGWLKKELEAEFEKVLLEIEKT